MKAFQTGKQQVQKPRQEELSKFKEQKKATMIECHRDWSLRWEMRSERQSSAGRGEWLGFYPKSNENLLEKF